jgi:hypothetical protein
MSSRNHILIWEHNVAAFGVKKFAYWFKDREVA